MEKYRLTLKTKAFGKYDEETKHLETFKADQRFECGSLDQLVGLLQFMVEASENELDLTIARWEGKDD